LSLSPLLWLMPGQLLLPPLLLLPPQFFPLPLLLFFSSAGLFCPPLFMLPLQPILLMIKLQVGGKEHFKGILLLEPYVATWESNTRGCLPAGSQSELNSLDIHPEKGVARCLHQFQQSFMWESVFPPIMA
jgi:hypothetical protein